MINPRYERRRLEIDQTFQRVDPETLEVSDLPLAIVKEKVIDFLGTWRSNREIQGVMLPLFGVRVDTSDKSQRKISELRRRAQNGEMTLPFGFKTEGQWIDMTLEQITYVDLTVTAHIQQCYAMERQAAAAVEAAQTVAEVRTILNNLS